MSTVNEGASKHPYRKRLIVSAGMLLVGGSLAMSTLWEWNASLFIIGQIFNGLGVLTAIFTLFQYLNRPRDAMDQHTRPRDYEQKFKGYDSQFPRKDR